jgi:hypothetical protein
MKGPAISGLFFIFRHRLPVVEHAPAAARVSRGTAISTEN